MKKVISMLLCASMLIGSGAMVFAAEDTDTKGASTPTGTTASAAAAADAPAASAPAAPIRLSLADAVKQMQTQGLRAETANINRQSDEAIASGYSETASDIRDMLENLGTDIASSTMAEASGVTALNQKLVKMRRDFAKENIQKNYQAEMNAIEKDTVQLYYGVLQAQDNVKAAQDNLNVQTTMLDNVQKKFKAGVAARKDVLSAQTSVTSAKSALKDAQVALSTAKMSLNMLLGYSLTQEVVLTDTLKMVEAPDVTLDAAIKDAVANRLDIKLAALGMEIQKIMLDNLKYTIATNSSAYKKQEVAYLQTKQGYETAPIQVEMDIRNQYAALEQKKLAVESAQATADFAKEGHRLTQISYDAGVATLAEVQEAQLQAFRANQAVSAAISDYDLAVYEFKYAQGVGTSRITL